MRISDWSSDVCSSDLFLQRRAHIVAKEGEAGFGTELVADLSVDAREGRIGRRVDEIAVEEAGLEALFLHEPGKDIVVDILIEYAKLKPSAPRCFAQGEIHCLCGLDGIRIFLEASGTFEEPGLEAVVGKAVARRINLSDVRPAF